MSSGVLPDRSTVTIVAATSTTGSAPTAGTLGYTSNNSGGRVRTFFDYTASGGSVTACNVRLYTRRPGSTAWYRGISTDESGYPLAPASGDESRDWDIGENVEFTFVVEAITQTGDNTVAVRAAGIER